MTETGDMSGMNPEITRLAAGELAMPIRVGRVPHTAAKRYLAESRWVYLSRETLLKQLSHHPDIELGAYENLAHRLERSEIVANRRDNCFIAFWSDAKSGNSRRWKATMKVVAGNRRIMLMSLHLTRPNDYRRILKRAKT